MKTLVVAALLLAAPVSTSAATITLSAIGFGTAQSDADAGPWLSVSGSYLAAGWATDMYLNRAILEFDLSSIAPGAVVTSASFSVTSTEETSPFTAGNAYRQFAYASDGVVTLSDADAFGATSLPDLVGTGLAMRCTQLT